MKNSRTIKNVIMIAIIIFMIVALIFTIKPNSGLKNDINNRQELNNQNMPFNDNSNNQNKPEDNTENKEEQENDNSNEENNNGENNNRNEINRGNRPERNGQDGNRQNNRSFNKTDNKEINHSKSNIIFVVGESIIISSLTIYLIMSKFNKKTFKETLEDNDKVAILILGTILLTTVITVGSNGIIKNHKNNNPGYPEIQDNRPSIDNRNNSNNHSNIEETT